VIKVAIFALLLHYYCMIWFIDYCKYFIFIIYISKYTLLFLFYVKKIKPEVVFKRNEDLTKKTKTKAVKNI